MKKAGMNFSFDIHMMRYRNLFNSTIKAA